MCIGIVYTPVTCPHTTVADSVGLGWGQRKGIANKFQVMLLVLDPHLEETDAGHLKGAQRTHQWHEPFSTLFRFIVWPSATLTGYFPFVWVTQIHLKDKI